MTILLKMIWSVFLLVVSSSGVQCLHQFRVGVIMVEDSVLPFKVSTLSNPLFSASNLGLLHHSGFQAMVN